MNTKFLITLFILVVCTRAVQSTNRKTQRNFIYSIKSVVGRLCSDITTIKEKITDLEKGNDEQQEKINDLEIENDEQQEKISDLEIENDELQEKVRELDDLQIKVSDLEIENNELKLKVSDLEQSVSQTDPVVAFTAYVDENTETSGPDDAFVFNKVLTNVGQAYDESTGAFTCPISGIYVFTVVATSIDRDTTWATLRVNSNYILDIFAEGHATGHDDQNANTAVVQCNEGDKVWVYGDYGILSGQNDENVGSRTASFSGFLLHPTTV